MIFRTARVPARLMSARDARGPEDYENARGRSPAWNQVIIE